jgi:predicted SnoaL-like aldol condensation-catalyzing enzyme
MTEKPLKEIALEFLSQVVAGDIRGAYEKHASYGLRHHNLWSAGNAGALRAGMEGDESRRPGKRLDVRAALQDGDRVAVHTRLVRGAGEPEIAVMHLFRFENATIAEMWDVAQPQRIELRNPLRSWPIGPCPSALAEPGRAVRTG